MNSSGIQLQKLNTVLELTDSIINKKYLSFLENHNVYQLCDLSMNQSTLNIEKHARIFHLKRLVYDTDENFLNKLITVVNVAYALKGTIITSIKSSGDSVDFYIGIVAKEKKGPAGGKDREALLNAFEGTISGNFNGSEIGDYIKGEELQHFTEALDGNAVCAVSVVPSLRDEKQRRIDSYVQGIENLVDSLRGKKYTLLTIADPLAPTDLMEIRRGYEQIYNYLQPLYKVVETNGTSESVNISETDMENYTKGITDGISQTQSRSDSKGYSNGFNLGISFILQAGFNHSGNYGTTSTSGSGTSHQRSEQFSTGLSRSTSVGHSENSSTQVSVENRVIKTMLDKIEKNMKRIDECEGYGAFHSATYIVAENKETALNAAGNFVSLMKGEQSSAQVSAINCWEKGNTIADKGAQDFQNILKYLRCMTHPTFKVNEAIKVSTASMVSGPELTVQLGFPKKSINGLTVLSMHPFGRNIASSGQASVQLGKLYFMGQEEAQTVDLDINSLAAHTFITGSTGTGKSNAVYEMLRQLDESGVKYMVIEPAKGEYKHVLGHLPNVHVVGTNPQHTELLRINPFRFPKGIHVLEHVDRMIEIFNVCWPMYAAMPAVLKEAVLGAYQSCGWDLVESKNRYSDELFPTFTDLMNELVRVIRESAYSDEVKSNYTGSLVTRIKSLTNGLNGRIFCADEIDNAILFDENMIVDISRIGSAETKALIMGILVMRLSEYRMSSCDEMNVPLHHVTVLEEAHNILKRTSTEQSMEDSNMAGKSVEMISNAIAEMRTYGEGFIIADQSPCAVDVSAIRNTNTKIILRLPDELDRRLAGKSAGLKEEQLDEIAKLPKGVAVVYQNDWMEPVLCKISKYQGEEKRYQKGDFPVLASSDDKVKILIRNLLNKTAGEKLDMNLSELSNMIIGMDLPTRTKINAIRALRRNENCGIKDICPVIYDLVCTPAVEKEAEKAESVEEWRNVFVCSNDSIFGDMKTEDQNTIVECILREQIERFHKPENYLEIWNRYIQKEVM
jgi:hypothetical protein